MRYLHMTSFNWRGMLGTPAVLIAVTLVFIAQLAFTYLPVMHHLFDTRPLRITDGMLIITIGIAMMVALEVEKVVLRRVGSTPTNRNV
ncbi:hypothetical protein HORIV_35760 [Vreelandella olivaria]|uniref:Cation-transporting P-type ATPase C-terminal domain-containing protein n=1 Tax=Vreelandella olivaria TaxID=390919 RepID=A0ABM8HNT0_9GAMM|nr:hypothetical protein HORIV_35760 [Halomonas olivaria]